jgi:elongation factor 1-beta
MANVIVTLKVLPVSPEVNMQMLDQNAESVLMKYGKIYKKRMEPVAFGINAMVYWLIMDENKGGTDPVEAELKDVPEVSDVQVTDVTRMMDVE